MTLKQKARGRPTKADGKPTRERILDEALALFAEQGFATTTVRQIAGAVGITDPGIYAHFLGKEEIFDALMMEAGPALLAPDKLGTTLAIGHPKETLPETFSQLVKVWSAPRARLFTSLMLREWGSELGAALDKVSDHLRPVFKAWMNNGYLRRDFPLDLMIWELISPLASLRLAFLQAQSKPAELERALNLAQQHIRFFIQVATLPQEDPK